VLVPGCSYFKDKIEQKTKKSQTGKPGRPRVDEEFVTSGAGYLVY